MKSFLTFYCILQMTTIGQNFPEFSFAPKVSKEVYLDYVKTIPSDKLDVASLSQNKLPEYATKIVSVTPNGQYDKAGGKAGWVLVAVDKKEYWHHKLPHFDQGFKNHLRALELVTLQGKRKRLVLGPGKIGINVGHHRMPEAYILRYAPRGSWDRHLLIAHNAWEKGRQDIAETALYWAVKQGMPANHFSTYYAAMVALERGNLELSKSLTDTLKQLLSKNKHIPHYFCPGLGTLAWSHSDWELLQRTIQRNKEFKQNIRTKPAHIKHWFGWNPDSQFPLSEKVKNRTGKDLMETVIPIKDKWITKTWKTFKVDKIRDGKHGYAIPRDKYNAWCFTPKKRIQNLEFKMKFGLGITENPKYAPGSFRIILFNLDWQPDPGQKDTSFYSPRIVAEFSSGLHKSGSMFSTFRDSKCLKALDTQRHFPWLSKSEVKGLQKHLPKSLDEWSIPENKSIELIAIRLKDEVQFLVNDKVYLHLPVDSHVGDIGILVQFVGSTYCIKSMSLREIQ